MDKALIAIMGPYPHDLPDGRTTHDCFKAMASATTSVEPTLFVIPDLVPIVGKSSWGNPAWHDKHRGLATMRCLAARLARDGEYDWLFIVENDALLQPDALDRLVAHNKDVIVPHQEWPDFPPIKSMNYQPVPPEGATGLHRIEWCGYAATLYRMAAFDGIEPMFVGGGEGQDYGLWLSHGIGGWMDLDCEATVLELPGAHKAILFIPGIYKMHRKRLPDGSVRTCHGSLLSVNGSEGTLAAKCLECDFYVEYRPPAGYRGETLRQLGLLGPAMAASGQEGRA